jgi:hypothetical protein
MPETTFSRRAVLSIDGELCFFLLYWEVGVSSANKMFEDNHSIKVFENQGFLSEVIRTELRDPAGLQEGLLAHDGLMAVPMRVIREEWEAGALKWKVRAKIEDDLRAMGIGWLPRGELPNDQKAIIRLYLLDGPLGKLLDVIDHPNAVGDDLIRSVMGHIESPDPC